MATTNRAPQYVIDLLEHALRRAKLDEAQFGMRHDKVTFTNSGPRHSESPKELDAFIKRETRPYRESYLIPNIERALMWARGDDLDYFDRRPV